MVEALLNDVEGMLASHASRTLTVVEISEEKPELWCGATREQGTRLSQAAPTGHQSGPTPGAEVLCAGRMGMSWASEARLRF